MHPALSKSERKRYAGYDPDKWYPWTPEISAEFTELMRRSPRDTSFARGFAYVAQRAIPEGQYVPTGALLDSLPRLPAAFRGSEGSGFHAEVDRPGHSIVRYRGMPGFSNVCIAIQGELVQRLQASGAHSVVVKHRPACRLNGDEVCEFEVEWSGESPPADARPARTQEIAMEIEPQDAEPLAASAHSAAAHAGAASSSQSSAASESEAKEQPHASARGASHGGSNGGSHTQTELSHSAAASLPGVDLASSEDLFIQLRKRLAEADRQARLYADAQQEIDRLRLELGRIRAQAEAEVAQAEKERNEALDALADLKRRVRAIVGTND